MMDILIFIFVCYIVVKLLVSPTVWLVILGLLIGFNL